MTRYARYKPTGIPWLPEVPDGWKSRKMKYLFRERSDKGHPEEPSLCSTQAYGVIPQSLYENRVVETSKSGLAFQKLVQVGDFVISLRAFQGGIEIAHYRGIISAAYTILEPHESRYAQYFKWLFKSQPFIGLLKTCVTGIREGQNINYQILSRKQIPIPPLPEQQTIAAYLDSKCGKIDRLVAAKEKEVALLKELKQSMIAEAVTGRTSNRPMKPSGIPWLPEVPEGWEVKTLRQLLKMVSRKGFPEKRLLSVTREQGVIVRDVESKEENHNFIPDDLSNYKLVEIGDFAINKMKSWQGSYGVSDYEGIVSPAYYVCRLSGVNRKFFSIAIRSRIYVSFFARFSKGIRVDQWDLSPIGLKEIPFLFPPLPEQREIVAYIETRAAKIDAAVGKLEAEVTALKEYRERLIADVVTGQRKVA